MAGEPLHHRARQEIAFGVFRARGKARVLVRVRVVSGDIGDGIDQQLRGEPDAGVAAGDRDRRRQIAAGAVAGDADARAVAAEFGDARDDVAQRRQNRPRTRRESAFPADAGSRPRRRRRRSRSRAGAPAGHGFRDRRRPSRRRGRTPPSAIFRRDAIDPRGQRSGRALHFAIFHARDRRRRNGGARRGERAQRIARALRRHGLGIAQRQQRNDLGDDGIERCGHAGVPGGIPDRRGSISRPATTATRAARGR